MNALVATDAPKALSEGQKAALVTLLADDDSSIYQLVRQRILSCGKEAIGWVRPHTLSSDPLLRRRAQEVVQHLARQEADNRFLSFCVSHGEDLDLEEGVWLLARTQYPDINVAAYQALFDSFAGDLRERLAGARTPANTLRAINAYLFNELGFVGNQEHYYDPENSYMNRVVDRRTGNPISLGTLYWLLGRRLRLPIVGIGMPGHFLCRYQASTEAVFIDAFNRGKLLNRAECVRYLQQSAHGFRESFLAPISPGRALLRMCANLHQIYSQLELREEEARFQRYRVALAK
jgi:regulator of sirC expression with transglutaminase-like and TPR domain